MLRESKTIKFNDQDIEVKTLGFYQFTKLVNLYIELGKQLGVESNGLNKGQYFKKIVKEFNSYTEDDLTGAFSDSKVVELLIEVFNECYVNINFKELTIDAVFALLNELTKQ